MLQLFTFIRADLNGFRPASANPFEYEEVAGLDSGTNMTSEPNFPKSLFLIQPLSSSYELNTVAANAQASVPIPEGLDLNTWIVLPPRKEAEKAEDTEDGGAGNRKAKKSKKGKGKETGGSKAKGKKRRVEGTEDTLIPVSVEVEETEEEREERERVSSPIMAQGPSTLIFPAGEGRKTRKDEG